MTDGSDLAWLGLERHGDGRWSFELTSPLTRFDGKLYGGTGIAAAVATMEAETGRDALWSTVQFAGSADIGDRIDCVVEVVASGRRTSQVRMTAAVSDRPVLIAIGATGVHRESPVELQVGTMPDVPPPDECEPWERRFPNGEAPRTGWLLLSELRSVELDDDRFAIWSRMRDRRHTRASVGFVADMVPAAVVRLAGYMGGGTSLDNALRFGPAVDTEWVLLDFDPWFAAGGYVHGGARVWAEDGTLVGFASQTAAAVVWTGDQPPWHGSSSSSS